MKNTNKGVIKIDSVTCLVTAVDFLKLKELELQTQFFFKLDSIRKAHYPNNDQETSIMVDLTSKYLNRFLADINENSLRLNKGYEKEYHFNIAPKGYTDPEICKDKIAITYNEKHCKFRLQIYNTFFVEPDWCTESMVVYEFEIKDNRIVYFWRNEVG